MVVGQAESEKNTGNFELLFEKADDRDGAAAADVGGGTTENALHRLCGFCYKRIGGIDHARWSCIYQVESCAASRWTGSRYGAGELGGHFVGFLPGNQTKADFSRGTGRDHGLRAFSGITAPDAVNFESGTGPDSRKYIEA